MSEHKAFASLSSGLLARKGDARPAMRRQSFGEMGQGLDDLGWNDMGEDAPAESTTPQPGFVQGARYDDGDDNDKGVLAALGPLAGLSAAKAVQDHIQSESQQANSVREQQADIMKHFAVSDDEAWCDGEDYIDETAEEWDPEADDEGTNAFNEHKGIAKDYSAHKDMADLDPMQLAESGEPSAGFVPFAAEDDASEAEQAAPQPEAVEEAPIVDEVAFDASDEPVSEETAFDAAEAEAAAYDVEDVAAATTEELAADEPEIVAEDAPVEDSALYDLEFIGDIAEDEEAVAEHGAIAEKIVDEDDDKVPFAIDETVEAEDDALDLTDVAEDEPLELTDTVEDEEAAFEPVDAIDETVEEVEPIAAEAEDKALVLDAPEAVETEMVDPFAKLEEAEASVEEATVEDEVAHEPVAEEAPAEEALAEDDTTAEPAVDLSKVVPLSAPVRPRRPRAAPGSKEKAAFTLRLDKERHLKLRLASALTGQSAQKMLIEALDRMLDDMPELDTISNKEVG